MLRKYFPLIPPSQSHIAQENILLESVLQIVQGKCGLFLADFWSEEQALTETLKNHMVAFATADRGKATRSHFCRQVFRKVCNDWRI